MSGLTDEQLSGFQTSLKEQLESVAQCFTLCFDEKVQFSIGESVEQDQLDEFEALDAPGIIACLKLSTGEYLLALIPDELLPLWYINPDENQAPRIENLAFEWSMCLVSEDLQGEENTTRTLPSLIEGLKQAEPSENFQLLTLNVSTEAGTARGQIFLALTALKLPVEPQRPAPIVNSHHDDYDTEVSDDDEFNDIINRVRRLMPLTVPVSVHLAHKRIELKQLMSIAPGTLIVFNKSCEDLLDLYVKDQLYARGEAVKIGEKFGLKINEVGAKIEREPGIFTL